MTIRNPYATRLLLAGAIVSLFALAGTTFAQPVPFTQKPFTDVPTSHPHYEAIEYLRKNNIVRGYVDPADPTPGDEGTEFKPDRRINRAEFVQLATNPFFLQGEQVNDCVKHHFPGETTFVGFRDVLRDAWYADEVCVAQVKDLVDGYPDGTFRPGAYINFVEVSKILSNVFVLNVATEGTPWYTPYVRKMTELRAVPTSVNALNSLMTRGEMAEMMYRIKTQNTSKSSKTEAQMTNRFE